MDRKTDIPKKKRKITTKPMVITSQINALYAKSFCIEMEINSTTQHSGGASNVNLTSCAVDCFKNPCPF